ncbi:MAG: hypothetical protein J2P26_04825 [Nocardiopsaceae bacterium]|nr:hypothetical protein [Nocardiopsaceae bacterium]
MDGSGGADNPATRETPGTSPESRPEGRERVHLPARDQYVAGRDQYVAGRDQHFYLFGIPMPGVRQFVGRHRIAIIVTTVVIVAAIAVPAWLFAGSPDAPARAAKPPPSVSVDRGLLDSSDLVGLNLRLKQTELQLPPSAVLGPTTCDGEKAYPTSSLARQFSQGLDLALTEIIEEFPSRNAAKNAYGIDSRNLACGIPPSNNISSVVTGLGAGGYAAEVSYSSAGHTEAAYLGVILSGRYVLVLAVQTPLDRSFDRVSTFQLYTYAATRKVRVLPDAVS